MQGENKASAAFMITCDSFRPMFASYPDRWGLTPDGEPLITRSSGLLPVRQSGKKFEAGGRLFSNLPPCVIRDAPTLKLGGGK